MLWAYKTCPRKQKCAAIALFEHSVVVCMCLHVASVCLCICTSACVFLFECLADHLSVNMSTCISVSSWHCIPACACLRLSLPACLLDGCLTHPCGIELFVHAAYAAHGNARFSPTTKLPIHGMYAVLVIATVSYHLTRAACQYQQSSPSSILRQWLSTVCFEFHLQCRPTMVCTAGVKRAPTGWQSGCMWWKGSMARCRPLSYLTPSPECARQRCISSSPCACTTD